MPRNPFDELDRETTPPPHLKRRVIETLRAAGVVRASAPPRSRAWLAAAAVVGALAIGYVVGRATPASSLIDAPRFVLLLHEDSAFRGAPTAAAGIAEYTAWARALGARGELELGEKLNDRVERLLGAHGVARREPAAPTVSGLFIIRAANIDDAERIARTCPHLRYGGSVSVRPIDPT